MFFLAVISQIQSVRCPGYDSFFLAYDEKLCRLLADMSSAEGLGHERDRNRKPRMKSLWYPDTLRYVTLHFTICWQFPLFEF